MNTPKRPPTVDDHRQLAAVIAELLERLDLLAGLVDRHYSRQLGLLKVVQRAADSVQGVRGRLAAELVTEQPRRDGLDQQIYYRPTKGERHGPVAR